VPERFELSNEASCGAVGVGAGEVVAARIAVKLAGREHVPGGGEDRVAGSGHGFGVAASSPATARRGLTSPATKQGPGVGSRRRAADHGMRYSSRTIPSAVHGLKRFWLACRPVGCQVLGVRGVE
jgi:hypothetical protein